MSSPVPNLKQAFIRGSFWTLVSMASTQALRFGKNLILTRLLFPEAYGVLSIVWAVQFALTMLSDAGFEQAAIRHARGEDPDFLNTVWTAKFIRDIGLFIIICIIAYPLSKIYGKPELAWLLPVADLAGIAGALTSTNIYTLKRNMQYKLLTYMEVSNEILMAVVTLTWAYFFPGYMALVGGSVIGVFYCCFYSHVFLPGIRNKFYWDKKAIIDLFHFGKWILMSSMVFLVYSQGDRIMLGGYLDSAILGVYAIALTMSEAVTNVLNRLNNSVVFPTLSKVAHSAPADMKRMLYRMRMGADALLIFPIGILLVVCEPLVKLLYDSRYHEAGWMLQLLCIRLLMVASLCSSDSCLLSLGHSKYSLAQNVSRATWVLVGIPVGMHFFGVKGAIGAVALTELPVFFVLWYGLAKNQILSVRHELRSFAAAFAGIACGLGLLQLIGRYS
jgi:O-antigen/teichoic acid export membrane protein